MERIQLLSALKKGGSALESLVLKAGRLSSALLIQGALAGCVPESNKPSTPVPHLEIENSDTRISVDLPEEATEEELVLKPISAGIPPEEVALGVPEAPLPAPKKVTRFSSRVTEVGTAPAPVPAPKANPSGGKSNESELRNFFAVSSALKEPACWIPPSSHLKAGSSFDLSLHISNPSGRKLKVEVNTVPPIGPERELTVEGRQTSSVVSFSIPAAQTGYVDFIVSDKKDTLDCSRRFSVGSAAR